MTTVPAASVAGPAVAPLTALNKTGLGLAALLGLVDLPGAFNPTPAGQAGPPMAVLVLGSVMGVVTLVGVGYALARRSRGAVRVVAASRVVSAITALPAFFVDVPAWLQALVGGVVLLTVLAVVLMLTPARRSAPVLD